MTSGMKPNELRVTLVRAGGLQAMDESFFGSGNTTSDPYVTLTYDGVSKTSETKMKTLEPVYNEAFAWPLAFDVDVVPPSDDGLSAALAVDPGGALTRRSPAEPAMLDVMVRDWDMTGTDFLGRALQKVPLEYYDTLPTLKPEKMNGDGSNPHRRRSSNIGTHTTSVRVKLGNESKGEVDNVTRGHVELLIETVYNERLDLCKFPPPPSAGGDGGTRSPNELHVGLIRCRGLRKKESSSWGMSASGDGRRDVVAWLQCAAAWARQPGAREASLQQKTLAPCWHEGYSFEVGVEPV